MEGAGVLGSFSAPEAERKIMLVDDEDTVRDAVGAVLNHKGWCVDCYDSAENALKGAEGGGYGVILADINMPGMSGLEFLERLREVDTGIPVVMITGYPSIDLAVDAMKKGAVDFLAKPFKSEELDIVVRKALGSEPHAETRDEKTSVGRSIARMPDTARRRLEDKIKELSILHTISETLDDASDKEEIFRKAMDMARIITDADMSFIMAVDKATGGLVVRAASGYSDDEALVGTGFSISEEPLANVIRNRCYSFLLANDDALKPLVAENKGPGERGPLLLAPLVINREVVMILGLTGTGWGGDLTNDALTLLLNLTAKASLKLENIALSENILSSIIGALNSLINALDARDTYTRDHSTRVTQYALRIATSLGCGQEVLDSIGFAGPLHDIGKIGVRDDILLKKSSFTSEEREVMRTHVVRGEEILRPLNLMESEKSVVLFHHERWDGGGYPNGLVGKDIPLVARIFTVADTFDAMTSSRPYRKALGIDVAREEIIRCARTQFDPDVVDGFLASGILDGETGG